jgi:hypothetical protein
MFGSVVLEIAMGLILIYVFLALLVTTVTEFISRAISMRSKQLENGIRDLLNDPSGSGLAKEIFNHPLIKQLEKGATDDTVNGKNKHKHISSHHFALALFDIIAPAGDKPNSFDEVRDMVGKMENASVKKSLLNLVDAADNDLTRARLMVENWYDHAMDRVSSWYAHKTQLISLIAAFVIAFGMNADTIMIADTLSKSSTVREALVAMAENAPPEQLGTHSTGDCDDPSNTSILCLLEKTDLPLGWTDDRNRISANSFPQSVGGWIVKILGLIVTSLAVSLGAPFWFDVLNKVANLRAAGKRPKTAGEAS